MKQKILKKSDIIFVLDRLRELYPDAECALTHDNVWELTISVVLSAQTTDVSVNKVTGLLFSRYPDVPSLASASQKDVEEIIRTIGMYRTKSRNIINLARTVLDEYDGKIPRDYEKLIALPGVGRKTANVVLSVGFGEQRIAVDTHVFRVSNRIGLCDEKDVLKTELALQKVIPKDRWTESHHSLIWHGRKICRAINPKCIHCAVNEKCIYFRLQKK